MEDQFIGLGVEQEPTTTAERTARKEVEMNVDIIHRKVVWKAELCEGCQTVVTV